LIYKTRKSGGPRDIKTETAGPVRVLCVGVRDEADEIVATMLAQLLDGAGFRSVAVSRANLDPGLAAVSEAKPDLIYLSGVPPFAIARSRRVYRSLRVREPSLKIMNGLWDYLEDEAKAAKEISRGEEDHIATTLAQAVAQVQSYAERAPVPSGMSDSLPSLLQNGEAFLVATGVTPCATEST
jgi:hypothetical protein